MKVVLKNVAMMYPKLFNAETNPKFPDAKPVYSVQFMIDKDSDNHKRIEEAIQNVADELWKTKANAKLKEYRPQSNKFCYRDGELKEGFEDKMFLAAKRSETQGRPLVIDQAKEPITASDDRFYSGTIVNASVDIWAQDGNYPGIRCTLLTVQYVRNGERISGGAQPTDADFEEIKVEDEDLI